jgi:hypothetical protein
MRHSHEKVEGIIPLNHKFGLNLGGTRIRIQGQKKEENEEKIILIY